jgi:Kef-type K+ transport system membrane component KefB
MMKRSTFTSVGIGLLGIWFIAWLGEIGLAASGPEGGPGTGAGASHGEKVAAVLFSLVIILVAAKLGGHVFERLRLPAVLGELIGGIVLGNLSLVGYAGLEFLKHEDVVDVLAEIGVIFLLFEVGLESNVGDLMRVGLSSFLVASLGVIAPFFLGFGVSYWFLPHEPALVHVFIGATLCATSVGITARVLKDLGKLDTDESRIILGAAVIDDVMGLVILAIVTGAIAAANAGGGGISGMEIFFIVAKAVAFFVGAIGLGLYVSPRLFRLASKLRGSGLLLATSITFCFFLSYLAALIGLAPIVGAFSAGLILDEVHYQDFLDRGEHVIDELIAPIAYFLVPIFFVLMGIRVDLATFGQVEILGLAAALTVAAIIGKQVCSLGVMQRGLNRLAVGIGMIPRGEVGLIFAGIGTTLFVAGERVINPSTYSAVVIMVIITTLFTPPLLKWSLARKIAPPTKAKVVL